MTRRFVLEREVREFTIWLTTLLNGTVSIGTRLCRAPDMARPIVRVQSRADLIALTLHGERASGYLGLDYVLRSDDSGRFLMVVSSYVGLFRDAEATELLLHYDYEREKGDSYPEAHIHVNASSGPWSGISERALGKLHLPVGGRRFRPSLEDIIEFLITEGLAKGHPGWQSLVEQGRTRYRRIQLAALTRSDPSAVIDVLEDLDRTA